MNESVCLSRTTPTHTYPKQQTTKQACGELYCSAACRDVHWARGHRLLCVGPVPEEQAGTHPLVLYKMHAGKRAMRCVCAMC